MKADKTEKSFVMELANLQHDRRETTFAYGEHAEVPIAYNPGALPMSMVEKSTVNKHAALIDAFEDRKMETFLDIDAGVAYVVDPTGLADYVLSSLQERESISEQLDASLLEWPIARDGIPVPITREELLALPFAFVLAMYQAISDDMTPGKKSSRGQVEGRRRR